MLAITVTKMSIFQRVEDVGAKILRVLPLDNYFIPIFNWIVVQWFEEVIHLDFRISILKNILCNYAAICKFMKINCLLNCKINIFQTPKIIKLFENTLSSYTIILAFNL